MHRRTHRARTSLPRTHASALPLLIGLRVPIQDPDAPETARATDVADGLRELMPEALLETGFLLEHWQWLGILALVFLAVVADVVVRFLVGRVAKRAAAGERVVVASDTLISFERPLGILVAATVFGALLPALGLATGIHGALDLAASLVTTIAGVWAAYRLVDVFCGVLEERAARSENKFDDVLVPLLRRTLKILVVVVGIVFLASKWTEDLWGVVAGLGIGSLAIGFAARDSIENLFGTFTVLLDKPFQLGDWILVSGLEGTVEDVGFRSTRIRTFYDSVITVPNRVFISSDVDNMGQRRYRRIKTMLSLTYDTPPEKIEAFCEGVRQILRVHPYTRKDYYHVYLNAMSAASLDVLLYCFVATPDWGTELREKHRLFADILRLAEQLGVSFAFPTQTLHVARPEDLEHPDRPDSDVSGSRLGRRTAQEVVARSMAPFGGVGAVPPPTTNEDSPFGGDAPGDGAGDG
jgi:MscS family membrane protein